MMIIYLLLYNYIIMIMTIIIVTYYYFIIILYYYYYYNYIIIIIIIYILIILINNCQTTFSLFRIVKNTTLPKLFLDLSNESNVYNHISHILEKLITESITHGRTNQTTYRDQTNKWPSAGTNYLQPRHHTWTNQTTYHNIH
jgi:hypothetical protein